MVVSDPTILVLNLGLKSVRCIAFSFAGDVLSQSSQPVHTLVNNMRVEQDPREWRSLSWQVIHDVASQIGESVEYLTVTASASCLVALDRKGRPLCNSILVSDSRAIDETMLLSCNDEFHIVQDRTGVKSSPDLMLPKMMWLHSQEPDTFEQVAHFVNAGDYLLAQLTGRYVTDPNSALKFHYDIGRRTYPTELLHNLDLGRPTLPCVLEIGTELGPVLPDVAEELGIPARCRVLLSTYDALAAVAGTGTLEIGEATDMSGTVTSLRAVTDHRLSDPQNRVYVTPHFSENHWLAGGSTNLGGGIIEWLKQWLFSDSCDPYGDMERQVEGLPPCPGGLIFLPHLLGERTPIWNSDCRGVLFGLNRAHDKRQIVRAVFEGVAFSARHIFEVLRECQVPIRMITAAGGLSRLDTMNQIKADVIGVPIRKLENFETTAIGAALISLVGVGVYDNMTDAFEQFCREERVFEPDVSKHAVYDKYFELYLEVYESLRDAYASRARILETLNAQGVDELLLTENL